MHSSIVNRAICADVVISGFTEKASGAALRLRPGTAVAGSNIELSGNRQFGGLSSAPDQDHGAAAHLEASAAFSCTACTVADNGVGAEQFSVDDSSAELSVNGAAPDVYNVALGGVMTADAVSATTALPSGGSAWLSGERSVCFCF